jgi:hypothetical protein
MMRGNSFVVTRAAAPLLLLPVRKNNNNTQRAATFPISLCIVPPSFFSVLPETVVHLSRQKNKTLDNATTTTTTTFPFRFFSSRLRPFRLVIFLFSCCLNFFSFLLFTP